MSEAEIIDTLGVDRKTIYRVRRNYHEHGLEKALQEKVRSGAPSKIEGRLAATLTRLACSTPPEGSARWTLRLLTDKLIELKAIDAISIATVRTMLKTMNVNHGSSSAGAEAKSLGIICGPWKTCSRFTKSHMTLCVLSCALMNGLVNSWGMYSLRFPCSLGDRNVKMTKISVMARAVFSWRSTPGDAGVLCR